MLHVSATTGSTTALKTYPGNWLVATVIIPTDSFAKYYVQVVAFAQYKNLTLSTGTTILHDRGIPTTNKALRPELKQEAANLDTENYSDRENYCADYCPLNVGNVSTYGVQFHRAARKDSGATRQFVARAFGFAFQRLGIRLSLLRALSVRVNSLKSLTSTVRAFIRLWTAAARGFRSLSFV